MTERKRASIREVAQMAGVSVATVSNVLGARKPVNAALAARVAEAVRQLGYSPDRAAAQLRSGKARVVAVLVPSLDNPFFTSIIAALEQVVQPEGYDIVIASSNNDTQVQRQRLATLLAWRPSGLVILPAGDDADVFALLESEQLPFVVVDRLPPGLKADKVAIDNAQAANLAGEHLVGLGHHNVLVVASTLKLANIRSRVAAIRRFFDKEGLPEPQVIEAGLTMASVAEHLSGRFAGSDRPTGIIALTNFTTIGVMAALGAQGLRIPDDVSLVGFDDYAWMQASTPTITAVRQPVEQIGAQAWNCLRERIAAERTTPKSVRLKSSLQVRGSTRQLTASPAKLRRKSVAADVTVT